MAELYHKDFDDFNSKVWVVYNTTTKSFLAMDPREKYCDFIEGAKHFFAQSMAEYEAKNGRNCGDGWKVIPVKITYEQLKD